MYHQNGLGSIYGEDNWDPDKDYGTEYADIHFRIETNSYQAPSFCFTEETREEFYSEVYEVFKALGWDIQDKGRNGISMTITKGRSHLYLHPQDFSGEVLKNEIKEIAEALGCYHNTFHLRWVDLYNTVYDISDQEYEEYLDSKNANIRQMLFQKCHTTRTNKFYENSRVATSIAFEVRLRRISEDGNSDYGLRQTTEHIKRIMDDMISDGLLIRVVKDSTEYIRSINKTEQKKLKNFSSLSKLLI